MLTQPRKNQKLDKNLGNKFFPKNCQALKLALSSFLLEIRKGRKQEKPLKRNRERVSAIYDI